MFWTLEIPFKTGFTVCNIFEHTALTAKFLVRLPVGERDFYLHHGFQTGYGEQRFLSSGNRWIIPLE
jgi:hypothetical protein